MLFKKITYQAIRNYEIWKKKNSAKAKHQQHEEHSKKFKNGEKQR